MVVGRATLLQHVRQQTKNLHVHAYGMISTATKTREASSITDIMALHNEALLRKTLSTSALNNLLHVQVSKTSNIAKAHQHCMYTYAVLQLPHTCT